MKAMRILAFLSFTVMCATQPTLNTVDKVDINRFMGDWYIIATIPTFLEQGAYNAVESYRLDEKGNIATTFTFNKNGFNGPVKTYYPTGFIRDRKTNATWDMQFIRPFKAEYLIIYLNEDYSITIIGRTKRDYLWLMARTPTIPDSDYEQMIKLIASFGYETSKIVKIPQKWDKD